jgi:hypothetical protein
MRNSWIIARGRGSVFIGEMISWFIRIVIYDICITGIQEVLGVSRMVAFFIFLGILAALAFGGYLICQRMATRIEDGSKVPPTNVTVRLPLSISLKGVVSLAEFLSQFVSRFHHQLVLVPPSF